MRFRQVLKAPVPDMAAMLCCMSRVQLGCPGLCSELARPSVRASQAEPQPARPPSQDNAGGAASTTDVCFSRWGGWTSEMEVLAGLAPVRASPGFQEGAEESCLSLLLTIRTQATGSGPHPPDLLNFTSQDVISRNTHTGVGLQRGTLEGTRFRPQQAAITNRPTWASKQQKLIFSWFWRPESGSRCPQGNISFKAPRRPLQPLPATGGSQPPGLVAASPRPHGFGVLRREEEAWRKGCVRTQQEGSALLAWRGPSLEPDPVDTLTSDLRPPEPRGTSLCC